MCEVILAIAMLALATPLVVWAWVYCVMEILEGIRRRRDRR
jgi:hypothetical protein